MASLGRLAAATVIAVALAALPAGAAAKGQKAHKKSGGMHSMTGCLQKGDQPNTYKLTDVEGNGPKTAEIVEEASGVDLASHIGHKVTITGTSMSARAAAKAEGTTGTMGTKSSATGTKMKKESGEHYMKVDSVKMVSTTCP